MKIVYYRTLLTREPDVTPSEKILYSFLVSKSIERLDDIFESDGKVLNSEELSFYIKDNNNFINLAYFNNSKLAKILNMERKTIIVGMKKLRKKRYIHLDEYGDECIYVSEKLIKHGYFELHHLDVLCGETLIFYSYLKDKSKKYDNCIDTYKSAIAKNTNWTIISISKMLRKLYKLNLAERQSDGKLLIK